MESHGGLEDDEELNSLDYRTPKGQLIKLVESKMKKVEIDNSLEQVLDKFRDLIDEQSTFLDNGIYHMNFAEDALLLQSCSQLYGKKVDKLWDDLLEFHTRMVKYDEVLVKNSGDNTRKEARKLEVTKLEERLNRGKRKKVSLVDPNFEPAENDAEGPDNLEAGDTDNSPFGYDFEIFDGWKDFEKQRLHEQKRQSSVLVAQYNKQKYRLKPYSIPFANEIVNDLNDPDEFNTRLGRLISCQHIRHLFEYNDHCLLPDEDHTIAKLRFSYVLRKKWLVQNKIDPDAPYESYKEPYEKYQKEFFENEKRKVQNMPQKNSEDLLKFYKVLERKEQLAREAQEKLRKEGVTNLPDISFHNLIVEPLKEGYQGDYDPYIPEDMDITPDNETELTNLFVDLSKSPDGNTTTAQSDKPRSDSGYFDGGFEGDDESDHEEAAPINSTFNSEKDTTAITDSTDPVTANSETIEQTQRNETLPVSGEQGAALSDNTEINAEETSEINTLTSETVESSNGNVNVKPTNVLQLDDIFGDNAPNELALADGFIKKTDDMIMIVYNKDNESQPSTPTDSLIMRMNIEKQKRTKKELIQLDSTRRQTSIDNKRKSEEVNSASSPKKRKLTNKQIEALKKGLTSPVKLMKFESFFSMNYQTEIGEGNVARIHYQSDPEDDDNGEIDNTDIHNISGYHSDHEGSHLSDHDYCIPPTPTILGLQHQNVSVCDNNNAGKEVSANKDTLPFRNIDLLAEFSKNSDISREDIIREAKKSKESKTAYEQEREKVRDRVTEWRDYITPKLKQLKENDFDIHEYGSNILNSMSQGETKPFSSLVNGKSSAEVVRYFISTLQLANTLNVDICGAKKGELSNDTFEIKLLNKERYHEHFQEYQAPSEEHLHEKLEKVREIRKQKKLHGQNSPTTSSSQDNQPRKYSKTTRGTISILKRKSSAASACTPPSPVKKIKVLNYSVIHSAEPPLIDYQQPSTSQQADEMDRQSKMLSPISDVIRTPTRASIDSGFMPSCDEDFLELLDQQFKSTPVKPRKLSHVNIRKSFFN